jgi:hypothetical protein
MESAMTRRTPDIFLSPQQLDARAATADAKARALAAGAERDRLLDEADRDRSMARLKRLVGEGEIEPAPG